MSNETSSSASRSFDLMAVVFLSVLALATRVYGIWEWAFDGDEFFTVSDALEGDFKTPIKAGYYVLTGWMFKLAGVSEWTARLPAVVFGVLSIPVFYILSRNFVSRGSALIGALLAVFSGWHLHYSQFSRFYSAVFLFGLLSFLLYYRALHTGKVRILVLALVSNGLGMLFHPTIILAPLSCVVFSVLVLLVFPGRFPAHSLKIAKIHLGVAGAAAIFFVPYALRTVGRWASSGQSWGHGPAKIVLQTMKYAGVTVSVAAVFGLINLWRRDLPKATFVAIACALPVGMLTVGSAFMSARPDYVFYVLPLLFLMAGYFCDVVRESLRDRRLVSLGVTAIVLAGLLPEFASHYTSRMTLDVRDAIRFVDKSHTDGDKFVSLMGQGSYYWPENLPLEKLPGSAYKKEIDWEQEFQPYIDRGDRVWIVLPLKRRKISPKLRNWLGRNAFLVWQKDSTRFDYTFEAIQVYVKKKEYPSPIADP